MNERIRLLAIRADKGVGEDVSLEFCEKFAELIVCECADLADTAEPFKTSDLILKHFGVRR